MSQSSTFRAATPRAPGNVGPLRQALAILMPLLSLNVGLAFGAAHVIGATL